MSTLALLLTLLAGGGGLAPTQDGVVRAVLFHSPTCPHCRVVLTRDVPPLEARYGDRLHLLRVDVSQPSGQALYRAAVVGLGIPEDRLGVPTLVVGPVVLVGSGEIPERFPGLVAEGVERGGVGWPAIPGVEDVRDGAELTAALSGSDPAAASGLPLAWSVLAFLGLALARGGLWVRGVAAGALQVPRAGPGAWGLLVLGAATAAYLSFTTLTAAETVCGPVGDCAAVHASVYSRLLGVPVPLLGVLGYLGVAGIWTLARPRWRGRLLFLALGAGTLFSLYLTAVEIFVLNAVCLWCLASAVAMGGLLWIAASHR